MFRHSHLLATLGLISLCGSFLNAPAHAQMNAPMTAPAAASDPLALKRGFNLARDTAIRLNGGLSEYRPARCMYDSSINNRCLAQRDASGMVFHFPGGAPGWQEAGTPPTVVTILRVAPDGRAITQQIYNGPPRTAGPR
jgi:hypothetical protein